MHLNRLRSSNVTARLLVILGPLIAILAASTIARHPADATAGQAVPASHEVEQ